jgi:hypothetical protein
MESDNFPKSEPTNGEVVKRILRLTALSGSQSSFLHGSKINLVVGGTAPLDRTGARLEIIGRGGKSNRAEASVRQEDGDAARHLVEAK